MKSATRSRILIAVALAIAGYVFFSSRDDDTAPQRSDHAPAIARSASGHSGDKRRPLPTPTAAMLKDRVAAGTAAASLFASHSWYQPPPPPPPPPPQPTMSREQIEALNKPTAPPLPYAYMGSYAPAGQPPVFFLTRADRVYNVHVGDTLDSTYSVDAFDGKQLLLTYKPLNIQQQLVAEGSQ